MTYKKKSALNYKDDAFLLTCLRLCTGANIAGFVKVAEAMSVN